MKYAPKKVFIKENNEYVEISYDEFCRREKENNTYKLQQAISKRKLKTREKLKKFLKIQKNFFLVAIRLPQRQLECRQQRQEEVVRI